jgi:hypothetical protein
MVVLRGFRQAASYYNDKLMKAPVGHFFDVMTNGFGAMPSYASRVQPDDRWRIVAYIRVLQTSESGKLNDVPTDQRQNLKLEPAPNGLSQGAPAAGTPPPPATQPNPGAVR